MPVKPIEKQHVLQHATSIKRQRNIVMEHLLKELDTFFDRSQDPSYISQFKLNFIVSLVLSSAGYNVFTLFKES